MTIRLPIAFDFIKATKFVICKETDCKLAGQCAQHETAGDFRFEDGFTPDLVNKNDQWMCSKQETKGFGALVWRKEKYVSYIPDYQSFTDT